MYYLKTPWCPHTLQSLDWANERFECLQLLHQSSTCQVYLSKLGDVDVIVKRYMKCANASFQKTKCILNEIETHSKLLHANIIQLYGVFEGINNIYLVIERAKTDLRDFMNNKRATSTSMNRGLFFHERYVVKHVIHPLLEGVREMHRHGIIHRDIKPENILLGFDDKWKLCDFGYAMKLHHQRTTTILGTEGYISPEVKNGCVSDNHQDKGDLWAIGVVCYELLCDGHPDDVLSKPYYENLEKISVNAKDFLNKIFGVQECRPTANELLLHPFIQKYSQPDSSKLYQKILRKAVFKDQNLSSGASSSSSHSSEDDTCLFPSIVQSIDQKDKAPSKRTLLYRCTFGKLGNS